MKVLIIDDDFNNRDILRARLEQIGYEVSESNNGEDGLELVMKEKFSLILLDIMMPGKDGWQVCRSIKSHSKTRDVPVVVLTARSEAIDEMRSWESGADGYLTKPIQHAELLRVIQKLLSKTEVKNGTNQNT